MRTPRFAALMAFCLSFTAIPALAQVLDATTTATNISCNGGSNGSATAIPTGGTPPYTYAWSSGSTAATATGLPAGNWNVTVTDSLGANVLRSQVVTQPPVLSAGTAVTNVSCNGGTNGVATVSPSGGTGAYSYSWSPTGGTAATASGLAAGSYTATIRDANLCQITRTVVVTQPPALAATQSQTNVLCNGGATGSMTVNMSGGTPGYTYLWSPSGGTAATAAGMTVGTYSVTVTDANACSTTRNFTITQPSVLVATTAQVNMVCYGPNGQASVTPSGGTGPYAYSWSSGGATTQVRTGLLPGAHVATITDGNGCFTTRTFNITSASPQIIVNTSGAHATANGACNGTANAPASGGTGALTWAWAPSGGTATSATGLCVGSYTPTVTDANACSQPGAAVLVGSPASAPTIGVAAAASGQATVNFTPSASLGNLPLGFYRATCGAATADGPGSPLVVTGLANGTPVTCTVAAHNSAGISVSSAVSNSVTPATVSGAPTIGAATASNAQATVTFTAPASNGGSPITLYTATSSPTGITGTCAAPCTSITVNGLANGTAYTFTVTATNGLGVSAPSGASNSVTPRTVPGVPTIGAATAGNLQATVAFTAPASNGGSAITLYTATSSPSSITGTCTAPCTTITVNGLVNGTAYTFTVTATNVVGAGAPSAASNSVTPMAVPGAPTIGSATPGNGNAIVNFTAPASDGGSPITSYTVSCTPGPITASGAASPITVPGLANGTSYQCSVRAQNSVGLGTASANVTVAPALGAFSAASATGTGTISASFTGGGAGCTFDTPQFIGAPPGAAPVPPTAPDNTTFVHGLFDFRNVGCTAGATLAYTIVYPTALQPGTQYWKYGPTSSNATPHWYTIPATFTGSTVTFSITDGGLGDDDLLANGTIVDQGGPGVPGSPGTATAIPTLSEWLLMALALLMLGMAGRVTALRRGARARD